MQIANFDEIVQKVLFRICTPEKAKLLRAEAVTRFEAMMGSKIKCSQTECVVVAISDLITWVKAQ